MCGIAGIVRLDGAAASPQLIRTMTRALRHRGPDASGFHADGPVALGHQRLKIIDLSEAAAQPMANHDGSIWIVFNGEIYNYRELRPELEGRGYRFRSQSDTEALLHLYEAMGERCVERLDGMFAFAIWDQPRQRLFLARDRAGKKPLYYARVDDAFVFASEVKALLRHPEMEGAPAAEVIPHYFMFGYAPQGTTFYRGIAQLPPAHTMTVEAGRPMPPRRYWDLSFTPPAGAAPTEADARERVRSLVTDAVRKRLMADVPLGAFLSGGIDSSIVVGVMSRLLNRPVKTFSIGFTGDPSLDETPFARVVAKHFQTDHHEFVVEPKAIDLIETLVWHHDGPFGDASAIPTSIVSRLTREHVTVALNGDGGDEVFAGYLRFQACLAAERLPRGLVQALDGALRALPEPKTYHHWLRRAQRFFRVAANPLFTRLRGWISIFDRDLDRLLRPEIMQGIAVQPADYPAELLARTDAYSALAKVLYVNFMTYLPDDLLVKADRCAMAHSLEGRSPFLDHHLAEYVAGLPDTYKVRGRTTKYLLKAAFADLLPPEILTRGKKGFGVPLGAWFRTDLRDYLRDHLLSSQALCHDYCQPSYVEGLVQEHVAGLRDHGLRLWTLLTFEVWLRLMRRQAAEAAAANLAVHA
ncbi:MAG: asparagine synthase (glutamine-hydrolyzing) [Nitrospira sp.]|nr:asparagine synthase (glutamine-hydrolyzing) [Nitrospira sp.]